MAGPAQVYKCEHCGEVYRREDGLKYHAMHCSMRPEAPIHQETSIHQTAPTAQTLPTAAEIAETAAKLVGGDRQATHGDKSINFRNTAEVWNAILQAKARQVGTSLTPIPLNEYDVANMLEAFKIARRYSGKFNLDDHIDGAGYAACGGEIGAKLNAPK
jgi:hypothetical protein